MATTFEWAITGLNVVNEGDGSTTTAAWTYTGTSTVTRTAYTPAGASFTAPYSGAVSGSTVVDITITPATTENQVITALETALGPTEISALQAQINAAIDASIAAASTDVKYGPGGEPLPWEV